MKILQTARWFFPHVGGASIRVYQTAKNLVKFGHDVHLLVHNPKSIEQCNLEQEAPSYENYEGIHVYRLPYFGPNSLYWGLSIPLMAKKAIDIIKKEKIDVILSHNPPYLVGTSSWIASKFTEVPMVLNVHDVWGASHYSSLQSKVGSFLEKFCIKRAKKIIVPCRGLDEIIMKRGKINSTKIVIAPTGVDTTLFKPMNISEDIDALFVGNLAPWSGAEFFVNAANKLLEKNKKLRFMIVGDGIQRKYLENIGHENISFIGAVPMDHLPEIINGSKICVSSFPKPGSVKRETPIRPISALEFMACGKPVIISDVHGIRELITEGKTGFLFKAENTKDLADKIAFLLKNREMRNNVGKNAREFALDNTWEKTARIVEKTITNSR